MQMCLANVKHIKLSAGREVRQMLELMTTVLPFDANSITGILDNLGKTTNHWGTSGTFIVGLLFLMIGIGSLLKALWSLWKHQPSGIFWIVGILGLILGGYFARPKGFDDFKDTGTGNASKAVNSAIDGQG